MTFLRWWMVTGKGDPLNRQESGQDAGCQRVFRAAGTRIPRLDHPLLSPLMRHRQVVFADSLLGKTIRSTPEFPVFTESDIRDHKIYGRNGPGTGIPTVTGPVQQPLGKDDPCRAVIGLFDFCGLSGARSSPRVAPDDGFFRILEGGGVQWKALNPAKTDSWTVPVGGHRTHDMLCSV